MKLLMSNQKKRERIGAEARDAMKSFAPEIIWDRWEKLFREVIDQEGTKTAVEKRDTES